MIDERMLKYVEENKEETLKLLKQLAIIPAPSHKEDRRVDFIYNWIRNNGAVGFYIDKAKNVVWPYGNKNGPLVVIMAHTDVVFNDEGELPFHEDDKKVYAPGIGDDSADVVQLLMLVRYLVKYQPKLKDDIGLLIVFNSCEEGLGNLKGVRQICEDYKGQIRELISFDGNYHSIVNDAVGSHRYKIHIKAEGGHSYGDFGNDNAIVQMAEVIGDLYKITLPKEPKTTYNVGTIEGGSTVNSIAEECHILYEYRSCNRDCLEKMKESFEAIIKKYQNKGYNISVEILGLRPCKGDVNEEALNKLTQQVKQILASYSDKITIQAGSTDANTPLSLGIPAITTGCYLGGGAHTRGEWVEKESLVPGQKLAFEILGMYLV